MGTRTGDGRTGNGTGLNSVPLTTSGSTADNDGGRFEEREYGSEVIDSGSDPESDSDDDTPGFGADRRGVKRERSDGDASFQSAPNTGSLTVGYSGLSPGVPGAKPGKKTRGRVKIKMEFIDNKLRRYTTFSKRKTGIMKKAYELSTLTGTQVLLLVASETGHVYTFATRKLQPMITSENGKALIQTCLNSPDSPPRSDPSSDQRMSATGFEETDLSYQVSETDGALEVSKESNKPAFILSGLPGSAQPTGLSSTSSATATLQTQSSVPTSTVTSTNGAVLKTSAGVVFPGGFTLMSGTQLPPGTHTIPISHLQGTGVQNSATTQPTTLFRLPATVSLSGGAVSQPLQTLQVQNSSQQTSTSQTSSENPSASSSSSTSVSSSSSSHMMYPGGHTVMYTTPTPALGDGGLTVLNTFPSTGQSHDPASIQQVFLTSLPPVAAQIPVSAVQLHPMVISQQSSSGSSNLTELQVVSLDVHQSKEDNN
ncbi:serum response factor-like isoform X2 [Synchiropus splendidus]|uniref:serum response factor-like isoform X2 n=1 Tax=Synchiropus splendidus TaxID=270530 RepID=UPI00237EA4BF|nr:serum response factor-like isoform X2 [Synchiropus splendidus]